jgi:hypothetical protein
MSNISPVLPQANVAVSLYDVAADDTASAFLKYNTHQHNPAISPSFTSYDIKIGDPVYLYNAQGNELYPLVEAATVTHITDKELRVSQSVTQEVSETILYYRAPRGAALSKNIPGVKTSAFTNVLRFNSYPSYYDYIHTESPGRDGYLTKSQLVSLQQEVITASVIISSPLSSYILLPHVGLKGWLKAVSIYSYSYSGIISLVLYSEADSTQSFSNRASWKPITETISVSSASRTRYVCLEEALPVDGNDYPLTNAVGPVMPLDAIALSVSSSLPSVSAPAHMQIALQFNKVIN